MSYLKTIQPATAHTQKETAGTKYSSLLSLADNWWVADQVYATKNSVYYAKKILLVLFISLCLPLENTSAQDEYYTWIDKNGVRNFSQREPKEYAATYVSREASRFGYRNIPIPNATKSETPQIFTAPEYSPDPQFESEQAAVQQEIAQVKASNCRLGKRNLARLEAYARIRVRGDDGTETLLTEEAKQQRISAARKTIADNCLRG